MANAYRQITTATLFVVALIAVSANPANAQRVQKNAMERSKFYESQREIQIIDDRPVIRDFRQAPEVADSVELPPPPPGFGGQSGGNSAAGALGNLNNLPRVASQRRAPLPSAGFANHVPAALAAAPRASQNTMGRMLRSASRPATGQMASAAPVVASYGNYGGGNGYAQSQSSSNVRGTLLHH